MSVDIEAQIGSTAEFARIVESQLADVETTVARVSEYLEDPLGVRSIAPTATVPPTYPMPEAPPSMAEARPSMPIPVIPGPAKYGNTVPSQYSPDRDGGGRRTPRTFAAAGNLVAPTALELDLERTAPRVDAGVVAAVARYDRVRPGEDHPGFSDLGHTTGQFFDPNGKKGRYKADLWHEGGAWDPSSK